MFNWAFDFFCDNNKASVCFYYINRKIVSQTDNQYFIINT